MDFLTIITIVGGIILTLGYVPQIIKMLRTENTEGINIAFWYMIYAAVTITAFNLLTTGAPVVLIVIQIVNAVLACTVLIMVHIYRDAREWQKMMGVWIIVLLLLVLTFLPMAVLQAFSTALIVAAYVSQLITLIKADSVEGVSPSLYLLIALGLGTMATKMFVTDVSIHIIITELVNISLLLACAGISLYYQNMKK